MLGSEIVRRLGNAPRGIRGAYTIVEGTRIHKIINIIHPEFNYEIDSKKRYIFYDSELLLQEILYFNSIYDRAKEQMRDLC